MLNQLNTVTVVKKFYFTPVIVGITLNLCVQWNQQKGEMRIVR